MENNKIEELMANDEFVSKVLNTNNNKEVEQIFKDFGVDVTSEQVENLRKTFLEQLNKVKDNDFENIVGGTMNGREIGNAAQKGVGYGGAYGMWCGAGIGAVAGVVDASVKAYNGKVKDTWSFIKEAFKISVKSSLLGGAAGAGLGVASGSLYNIGEQGDENLKKESHVEQHEG